MRWYQREISLVEEDIIPFIKNPNEKLKQHVICIIIRNNIL